MTDCLLGTDAGTTRIKTVAVAPDGTELARAARDNPVRHPREEWAEQDMQTTWERTAETVAEVVAAVGAGSVAAVGLTGQGGGCWLVDDDGDPVRDAVLWTDARAADVVETWRADGTYADLFERCGYGAFPGLSLPVLCWFREHEPATLERADTVLFCKDWIRSRLTGTVASDYADASLAHHDLTGEGYVRDVPDLVGVPELRDLEPDLLSPTAVAGTVTGAAASATGLPEGTPVVAGTIDVAASAYGSGVADPGAGSTVVGTTLQNQVVMDRPRVLGPQTGYTLDLGVEGLGLRTMGAMAGTPNLDWARDQLAVTDEFTAIETEARSVPVGAEGLLYHPYLSAAGEKAPFVDPAARAQFTGIDPGHTRAHLLRAVYEGVALSARDCYEALPEDPDTVTVGGGGARSAFWCQLFADCLDATVAVPAGDEFGARGAAMLAAVGTGRHADLESAIGAMTGPATEYTPRPDAARRYDRLYDAYAAVADAMTPAWSLRASVLAEFD